VLRRVPRAVSIGAGFVIGLFLASLDKWMSPAQVRNPFLHVVIEVVDWTAPPLCGALVALSLSYAMRQKRMADTERAAAQVLAERLAGTERRQALWVVAAAVAHDLKNPLHNLHLLVEELSEDGDAARREDLLKRVRENLKRATDRIQELARVGFDPVDDDLASVEVSAALDEVRSRLLPHAAQSRTEIVVDCPKGLHVKSAPLAVRSAIENVAANGLDALRARGHGGTLALKARLADAAPGLVEVVVEDDGPGIPEPLRTRLFVPFAASHAGSTGLGLAIARALARAGGGDLVCTDFGPGHTRFRFTFQAR
jgi:signal transduction histidine kinase